MRLGEGESETRGGAGCLDCDQGAVVNGAGVRSGIHLLQCAGDNSGILKCVLDIERAQLDGCGDATPYFDECGVGGLQLGHPINNDPDQAVRLILAFLDGVAYANGQSLGNCGRVTSPHLAHNGQFHGEILVYRSNRHLGLARNFAHGNCFIATRCEQAKSGFQYAFKSGLAALLAWDPFDLRSAFDIEHRSFLHVIGPRAQFRFPAIESAPPNLSMNCHGTGIPLRCSDPAGFLNFCAESAYRSSNRPYTIRQQSKEAAIQQAHLAPVLQQAPTRPWPGSESRRIAVSRAGSSIDICDSCSYYADNFAETVSALRIALPAARNSALLGQGGPDLPAGARVKRMLFEEELRLLI